MKIQLQEISKRFGSIRANDNVSMTFMPGTIHGILGENGAGKSTLMKIVSGYHRPDSGSIMLDGTHMVFHSPKDALAAGIGMLYQEPLDFPNLTALENFMLGRPGGWMLDLNDSKLKWRELTSKYGFTFDPSTPVRDLSFGERQQLEIMRLLAIGIRMLILDEPTSAISEKQKEELFSKLEDLAGEGRTILYITHKLDEAQALCRTVTVMSRGRITGRLERPLDKDRLVEMMFGSLDIRPQEISRVEDGETCLRIDRLVLADRRCRMSPIDLNVRHGELIGLGGLEGSGQRLFLRACAGIERSISGNIILENLPITRRSDLEFRKLGIAYLPADRLEEGLIRELTVAEHVAVSGRTGGFFLDRREQNEGSVELIDRFHIKGCPDDSAAALSGGNQQRLLLALLPGDAKLLLLEHPTRGLDFENAALIWDELHRRVNAGTAVMFISSDLDELLMHSHRIAVFYNGNLFRLAGRDELSVSKLGHWIGGHAV